MTVLTVDTNLRYKSAVSRWHYPIIHRSMGESWARTVWGKSGVIHSSRAPSISMSKYAIITFQNVLVSTLKIHTQGIIHNRLCCYKKVMHARGKWCSMTHKRGATTPPIFHITAQSVLFCLYSTTVITMMPVAMVKMFISLMSEESCILTV